LTLSLHSSDGLCHYRATPFNSELICLGASYFRSFILPKFFESNMPAGGTTNARALAP
jgi:hypothetical protein